MFRLSNTVLGILNFLTFLFSIPILWAGIWLKHNVTTECSKHLDTPIIIIGVFLMAVSLAGFVGACCRVTWLLWLYLLVMFLAIVALFFLTIFAFVVTNKGAGEVLSGKGYKEYRLGDYSNWLQKRVNSAKDWKEIRSCLQDGQVCQSLINRSRTRVEDFYKEQLSSVQSGCCKPSNDCNFVYVSPTNWTAPANPSSNNSDCTLWSNDPNVLCFNCQSCKAGMLDNIKHSWKKVALTNIIFLVILVIVYSIGCCAFRNSREDNYFWKRQP